MPYNKLYDKYAKQIEIQQKVNTLNTFHHDLEFIILG